ncbi:hypothetical protein A4R29_11160 [Mesorhizobium ciceri biovar biserrulae]|nr:hypothetical protein A4R29_11160 [Mesorhizobium ciceri biovar biserrulae]
MFLIWIAIRDELFYTWRPARRSPDLALTQGSFGTDKSKASLRNLLLELLASGFRRRSITHATPV